jgi:arginase
MSDGKRVVLIGVPTQAGTHQKGCLMGPDALRTAGIAEAIGELGHCVDDQGNLTPTIRGEVLHANGAIHDLGETVGWIEATAGAGAAAVGEELFPVFLGGDHSMSAGTVAGVTRAAKAIGRPQFVLWLDAHSDFHTPDTTTSGNLHGTPLAYVTGMPGFAGVFPDLEATVDPANIAMIGIRSVDPAERAALRQHKVEVHDMRRVDQHGMSSLLLGFIERVRAANGLLHVSLDVDFLDPDVAPAVGTTVPGGATFREAHLVMELISDSGLMTSLDVAELNPFLDERGKSARLLTELTASLFGRTIIDRPARQMRVA